MHMDECTTKHTHIGECCGELWECESCGRQTCWAEGTDDDTDKCDLCWYLHHVERQAWTLTTMGKIQHGDVIYTAQCEGIKPRPSELVNARQVRNWMFLADDRVNGVPQVRWQVHGNATWYQTPCTTNVWKLNL